MISATTNRFHISQCNIYSQLAYANKMGRNESQTSDRVMEFDFIIIVKIKSISEGGTKTIDGGGSEAHMIVQ